MDSFANRLNKAMELRNIKQAELVEKTGITKGAISQYLKGEYEPKQINTYKIAKALSVNPAWLMGKDVDIDNNELDNYYIDEEVRQIAQELFNNKELRMLMDASRKVSKEDLKNLYNIVKSMKKDD